MPPAAAANTAAQAPVPGLQALHPGNFALVMATGIIAIGFGWVKQPRPADALAAVAGIAWLVLVLLNALRTLRHWPAVKAELLDPRVVFSFFTLVAATDIVGVLLFERGWPGAATACWLLACVAWCSLLYLAFAVLTLLSHEQNVNIVHGGWLIAIVGTQSLVVLGTRIAPTLGGWTDTMMLGTHMLWGLGLALYGIFITLFCYRIFFLALRPQDVGPLLWVVMGAAAISANAGTSLILSEPRLPFLLAQRPFIDGVTMLLWAWATWWIPMLVVFGLWKHVVHRLPLRYEPAMWSLVFPLGMYSVASARLGLAAEFPTLAWIAGRMIWVAFAAWLIVLSGLARRLARRARHA
ncbi:MAG: tellurite resistance/C4-dicarboxylate transporter family protein [Rubrivivax sp.]